MGQPARPIFRKQLTGTPLAGFNCTAAAAAMLLDRATLGRIRLSPDEMRRRTGDKVGGSNIRQYVPIFADFDERLKASWAEPIGEMEDQIHAGRGVILAGSSRATKGTKYQGSETFDENHAWEVNEGRGWRVIDGHWRAEEYLVYDPLGDDRRPSIVQSPFWLPRKLLVAFAGKLNVSGKPDNEKYTPMGIGRAFWAACDDTEPHFHPHFGGTKTSLFPNVLTAKGRGYLRTAPRTGVATRIRPLKKGEHFSAFQKIKDGPKVDGSTTWYGNHNGDQWVPASRMLDLGSEP